MYSYIQNLFSGENYFTDALLESKNIHLFSLYGNCSCGIKIRDKEDDVSVYANMFEVAVICVTLGKNGLLGPVMHTRKIRLGFVGSYLF
jgi:hypothetical protein